MRNELLDTADKVWNTGQHLNGYYTENFEKVIAERCDRKYAISVNSGTQALIFAIRALQLPFRSKIAMPALSFIATLNSVLESNFVPHLIDVDKDGLIDITADEEAIGYNALMYVNLYGNMVDYDKIKVVTEFFGQKDKLPVIEDAAQSFGSTWKGKPSGSFGDISILSFDPMKNFNSYGSGGMALTDDKLIAGLIGNFAKNGKESGHSESGTNSRMSELDCACMLVKLNHFDEWQLRRQNIADYWQSCFKGQVRTLRMNKQIDPCWHKYPLFLNHNKIGRDKLQFDLREAGIETKVHYDKVLHEHPCHKNYLRDLYDADLRAGIAKQNEQIMVALQLARNELSLPIYPEMTDSEVEHIKDTVLKYVS